MDLEAWVLPAGRLGLVAACAVLLCGPAVAGDDSPPLSVTDQFKKETDDALALMLKAGLQVVKVTPTRIVISSIIHDQCTGTTQPNVLRPQTFQNAVAALKAINDARAKGKEVTVTTRRIDPRNCMVPTHATPAASAPQPPAAPASPASR